MGVSLRREGRLARILLDRPPLNVLDLAHLRELGRRLEEARGAAVILLEGGGGRAFCAGNDVADHAPDRAPEMLEAFHGAVRAMLSTDAVTVAFAHGDALGGGCELVAACDLAYGAPGARFGQPEIDVGCFPPVAASLLPARIGWKRACELVLLGRRIDAAEAAAWGLLNGVGDAEEAVRRLLGKSPAVLLLAKRALRAGTLEEAERIYREELLPLDDCAEGVRAFLEKRAPRWAGG
ncbi:MAG: enoyl-CoA hydratase/isomerase family protein [Planctomycetaceae bacterium]